VGRYVPELLTSAFTRRYPTLFPYDADGRPATDHLASLLDMHFDSERVPELSLRDLGTFAPGFGVPGEDRYMIDRYLRERGDANIQSNADLIAKATFYDDPNFPDRRRARENAQQARAIDTSLRIQNRFAFRTILLQCMRELRVDVLVAPTASVPPRRLTAPREPTENGRSAVGWSLFGQQGFPVITVPAGFTTAVWDRVRTTDGGTRLEGPVRASLPVGVDLIARPFYDALLFRVGAAYEAATLHRRPPPEFGPVAEE
jgi:Asp-tRNA(Asn)/Glu-tRNA(Gln) amidotransferase A subunit family amidase